MEMRTGHTPGRADLTDDVAADELPLMDVHDRQMGEQRKHTEAVVDHDRVAREIEIPREHDTTAVRGMNGSARRAEKVGAAVRLPRLAVENAARAKCSVRPAWHRSKEACVPQPAWLGSHPELLELGRLPHDTRGSPVP